MKKCFFTLLILLLSATGLSFAQTAHVLPMKDRARDIDELLEKRVTQLLPHLMEREKIDSSISNLV